mgnify:CR=1 FL=1
MHHLHDTLLRELLQDPVERRPRHAETVGDILLPGVGVVRVQVGQELLRAPLVGRARTAGGSVCARGGF